MTEHQTSSQESHDRVVSASREVDAPATVVFELIAHPARQPEWDGNGNLDAAQSSDRIGAVGECFTMLNTSGKVRENRVVEFTEGRLIAWQPGEVGAAERPGHLWRWELEPLSDTRTLVTHTYDWSQLTDEARFARARQNTPEALMASVNRLAELAESIDEA